MASEETDMKTSAEERPATEQDTAVVAPDGGQADGAGEANTAAAEDDGTAVAQETPAAALPTALQLLKNSVSEDDPKPSPTLTLGRIIAGDILSNGIVRGQIWLFLLIVLFTIVYVAFRYQCQQDMITIDRLETELKDAKYRALSSSSTLTERCRESHVLEILKNNRDSLLHVAEQPPYIIEVPEK